MQFHLPQPLHGWRAFAGEVGIIVVGVLIALAAQQFIDDLNWRSETRDFRAAVDHELGRNLYVWRLAIAQRPCLVRRLGALHQVLDDSAAGKQHRLVRPIGRPVGYSPYYSVWDDKGTDVTAHLPLNVRLGYAEIYDELHNQESARVEEREVWRRLARFDQPEPLDHQDRMDLRELLTRAQQLNDVETSNAGFIETLGQKLGIKSVPLPGGPIRLPGYTDFCKPLLAN